MIIHTIHFIVLAVSALLQLGSMAPFFYHVYPEATIATMAISIGLLVAVITSPVTIHAISVALLSVYLGITLLNMGFAVMDLYEQEVPTCSTVVTYKKASALSMKKVTPTLPGDNQYPLAHQISVHV